MAFGGYKPGRSDDMDHRKWVSSYQDPFHKRVAAIIDPITALRTANKLDYATVQTAQQKLEAEIAQLTKDQAMWEGLSSKHATTVAKSRETLDPIIRSWRDTFAKDLSGLAPPQAPPAGPPPPGERAPTAPDVLNTPGSIPPGEPHERTPHGQARRQEVMVRKRAMASRGRRSTLLGGSLMQNKTAPRKTLLGY
jgi:hypothetical protein